MPRRDALSAVEHLPRNLLVLSSLTPTPASIVPRRDPAPVRVGLVHERGPFRGAAPRSDW